VRERTFVTPHRFGGPVPCSEDIAEIVVKGRITAVSCDRHANPLDRGVEPAVLKFDQTKQMQSLRVTWADLQDLKANPFGLRRTPRALMDECRVEPLGDRRS